MYLKNFITLLRRYSTSSTLNIVGMAIGFAAVYLIMVQVKHDLSFNRVIPNSDRIYRMEYPSWQKEGEWFPMWNRTWPDIICEQIPEVEASGSIWTHGGYQFTREFSISRNATVENFTIHVSSAEKEGLEVFPFEFIEGGLDNFNNVTEMIISEEVAKKYDLTVGDVLHLGRGAQYPQLRTIVGVYKNFPKPSNIATCEGYVGMQPQEQTGANNWNDTYYVRLKEGASAEEVTKKMTENLRNQARKEGIPEDGLDQFIKELYPRLNPLGELYFATDVLDEGFQGSRTTTYTLIAIAALILIITFINFVNFFFALIPTRIRAINTHKVFGAPTRKLRLSILFETVGLTLLAVLGAAVLVLAFAETPLSEYISTSVGVATNWDIIVVLTATLVIFGMLVSLYPAHYITSFSPALVTKGSFHATKSGKALRYTLVGVQYTISITLIICSLLIQRQHKYMLNYDMGFNKEHLLTVEVPLEALAPEKQDDESGRIHYRRRDAFMDKIKQHPNIVDVTFGNYDLVTAGGMFWTRELNDNKENPISYNVYPVSWNFLQVMGIELEEGRYFQPSDEDQISGTYIFNREAAKQFGLTLDTKLMAHRRGHRAPIVGICKDFNFEPLHATPRPFAFMVYGQYAWGYPTHTYIRTTANADFAEVKKYVEETIAEFAPNANPESYEVKFYDTELQINYQVEDKLSTLVAVFSVLSIIISIIGVFGLVLFETQYRRREIGIRRVHGATTAIVLRMFNKQYLCIVAACSAIAIPLSYIIISRWMEQFAYRATMPWWIFAVAVAIIAVITVVTVSVRSWKAVHENPTNSIAN